LYQQKEGFNSCLPYGRDFLQVHTSMNTEPLSSTFPFVSFDLSSNDGILYGVNMHNNSLILFDRFSMDNYNETIFARSGSGKSVLGSEPVLVKQGGNIRLTPIGTLVDSLIAARGAIKIDEELEGVINPGLQVYSFDKSLHGSWSNVTVAARKEAPREFYAFTTKSGRKIVTTGDHNMVVLQNGAVVAAKSSEIARGECIPVPREISSEHNKDPLPINLLELLRDEKRLYVRGGSWIFQTYKKAMKQCLQSRYLHLQRYHCEYAHGRAVPLPYFLYLLRCLHINIDNPMLSSVVFCSKNSKTKYEYPVHFVLDSYWWKVMGYLIAEGTFTAQCIIFSNTDAEVLGDM
ncbi:MAG: hypothetical protein HYV78_01675, partial [Candidatus Wildermuthbacteria bacterium]|nr:hypothetical protein [Candidatus Wildermuthbacteria bacterium]